MSLSRTHKYLLAAGAVFGIAFGTWVIADTDTDADGIDDLPTLDSIQPRVSSQQPKLTLPNELTVVPVVKPGEYFVPPRLADLPDSKYAQEVRYGRNLFVNTQQYAKRYVGNGLNCSSCHLQEGRKPHAAPLWAAYPMYPMYTEKSRQVITFQERMQSCFRFSLNGMAPTLDSREIQALTVYAQWLSTGIPMGTIMAGRGFARIDKSDDPSPFHGADLYKNYCASCHGADLMGKKFTDRDGYMFPPLAGPDSYNKGAGMQKVKTCASFVKANMPLGKPYTLNDDESLEVCVHIFLQDRPWDPRKGIFMSLFMPVTEG
ncbi:MAG: c-type cytochrome [Sulfuriferula sp.]|nr:c-type cytochrome [Sulfuriferula sp.]